MVQRLLDHRVELKVEVWTGTVPLGITALEAYLKPWGQDEITWGVSIERKEGSWRSEPWMLLG